MFSRAGRIRLIDAEPGNYCVCVCGLVLVFEERMRLRRLTPDEEHALGPRVRRSLRT
ncbi:hypothetical protein [Sorangium sp. So ce887]|uniref:hypothetical protein n=1 Tax=Sorangium sp. So ce887 TaxID=3133324 RepID=UPI003F60E441